MCKMFIASFVAGMKFAKREGVSRDAHRHIVLVVIDIVIIGIRINGGKQ